MELKIGGGGKMARAAGCYAQLVGKDSGYAQVKLQSGELRIVRAECMATVGAVSNPDNQNQSLGKAGRNRWLGRRPHNRGVDHEPGRPPARRRRRPHLRRPPPQSPPGASPPRDTKPASNKRTDSLIIRRRPKGKH